MTEKTGTKHTSRGFVICCGRRKAQFQRCGESGCGDPPKFLCDYVVHRPNAGLSTLTTCDEPICEKHATVVGENRHHCPKHAHEKGRLAL